ncbi:putative oxysterol binding protein [Kalaharituber pfeilii]|nr:putative oxysterol binding protein [Kalaharituber pfeilii]
MLNGVVGHTGRRLSLGSNKSSTSNEEVKQEEEETIVDEGDKNVLLSIISQLRPGADLSRITLPTFILEPKSMLERITNFMQHPETLLPMPQIEDPVERFISVVKFYLSGWHIKPVGVKKPLNPCLGEFFTCYWEFPNNTQAFYISEQTSHHPPKSSYFYMSPENHIRIDGTLKPRSKFLGNSAASMMEGIAVLRLLNRGGPGGEKYLLTQPNMYVRGILFGKMKYELGDHSYVKAPELDLTADIEFKTKGYFTGCYDAIGGYIKRESTGEVLYELSGKWNEEMWIKNYVTGHKELLFDATHARATPPIVRPMKEQEERESRRLWKAVITALNRRDQQVATDEKFKIENRQREEARLREADGVEWKPRFFRAMDSGEEDEELDFIIRCTIDGATSKDQIKQILAIQPIMPGSNPGSRKFDIPPHHPHHTSDVKNDESLLDLSEDTNQQNAPPVTNDLLGELDDIRGIPALVPTTSGVAPAGRVGNASGLGLDNLKDLESSLPQPKPAGDSGPRNDNKHSLLDDDDTLVHPK